VGVAENHEAQDSKSWTGGWEFRSPTPS